jgi:transposase-like protein
MDLQAKTRQEVAEEFGISTKTLHRWLKKWNISVTPRDRICPKALSTLYEKLGCPKMSDKAPTHPKTSHTSKDDKHRPL